MPPNRSRDSSSTLLAQLNRLSPRTDNEWPAYDEWERRILAQTGSRNWFGLDRTPVHSQTGRAYGGAWSTLPVQQIPRNPRGPVADTTRRWSTRAFEQWYSVASSTFDELSAVPRTSQLRDNEHGPAHPVRGLSYTQAWIDEAFNYEPWPAPRKEVLSAAALNASLDAEDAVLHAKLARVGLPADPEPPKPLTADVYSRPGTNRYYRCQCGDTSGDCYLAIQWNRWADRNNISTSYGLTP